MGISHLYLMLVIVIVGRLYSPLWCSSSWSCLIKSELDFRWCWMGKKNKKEVNCLVLKPRTLKSGSSWIKRYILEKNYHLNNLLMGKLEAAGKFHQCGDL